VVHFARQRLPLANSCDTLGFLIDMPSQVRACFAGRSGLMVAGIRLDASLAEFRW
jgi:hypothetical protein